jgi:pimeloyl-ACP methyl ester carboxylesterase
MGGRITGLYTHAYPQQVISMAFFCNAGVVSPEPSEMMKMLEQGHNPLLLTSPDDFDRMLGFVSYKKPFIPWPVKGVMARRAFSHRDFNAYIFSQYKADRSAGLEDKLPAIKNPTLILWGEDDRLLHVSSVEVMKPLLPQAEVVIMPETGHVPMAERPAETAAYYLSFINKHGQN